MVSLCSVGLSGARKGTFDPRFGAITLTGFSAADHLCFPRGGGGRLGVGREGEAITQAPCNEG